MTSPPFITVLITAHDRRDFIFDAIKSVISQDFPRDKYEIILVKYQIDNEEEIDRKLESMKIRVINTNEKSLGAKIALGAEEAKGEIIAFLEDDDLFLDGKLNRIYEVFKDNEIGFYHNEMRFVNINNEEIKGETNFRKRMISRFNIYFKNDLMIKDVSFWEKIPQLSTSIFAFNNSSISIRRNVICNFRKVYKLSKYNYSIDHIHFLLSLEYGYKNAVDKKTFTNYRVHSSSTMNKKAQSINEYFEYALHITENQLYNLELIEKFYKVEKINKLLNLIKECIYLSMLNEEDFLGVKTDIRKKISIILNLISKSMDYFYSPGQFLSYLYILAPFSIRKYIFEKYIIKKI
ncbi:glycosyltransferase family 2 protein [Sulfurisphaera javensis]|uniref:Glycosyltransferase family 2 protein n=1 Tax=Sulfurisphaera javensis TaxID=2049879 RepID=A0AAT9GNB0_9CREN